MKTVTVKSKNSNRETWNRLSVKTFTSVKTCGEDMKTGVVFAEVSQAPEGHAPRPPTVVQQWHTVPVLAGALAGRSTSMVG